MDSIVPEFGGTDAQGRGNDAHAARALLRIAGVRKLYLPATTQMTAAAAFACTDGGIPARSQYSDIGFIILAVALERAADEDLDRFCQREIFGPLGMTHTAYNPPVAWRASIPPTADDRTFRNRIIQGEVQDENASVLGGVAGHAGLFSTAKSLATFAPVLLQGGAPLVRAETLAFFTRRETLPAGTSRHRAGTRLPRHRSRKISSAVSFGLSGTPDLALD